MSVDSKERSIASYSADWKIARLDDYRWEERGWGLYQLPMAA